jgi:hypothetical protein
MSSRIGIADLNVWDYNRSTAVTSSCSFDE